MRNLYAPRLFTERFLLVPPRTMRASLLMAPVCHYQGDKKESSLGLSNPDAADYLVHPGLIPAVKTWPKPRSSSPRRFSVWMRKKRYNVADVHTAEICLKTGIPVLVEY
jgi:hypothetical protein